MRAPAVLCAAGLILAGCTTVVIDSKPEDVRLTQHFLAVGVSFEDNYSSRAVHVQGVGVYHDAAGTFVGAHSSETLLLGQDCRAVFWVNSPRQAELFTRLAGQIDSVCINRTFAANSPSNKESHAP